jgi:hypothetical protein
MAPRASRQGAATARAAAMRLLLIEFFPGALRRNEKSMLFPFLQGLAREHGAETLWLCFGDTLAPAAEGYGGRMLRAELTEADRETLARHLDAFRPTHVVSSDLLGAPVLALLDGIEPRPEHLVMPTVSDVVFAAYAADGTARCRAHISGDPARDDYLGRCGWFLRWAGVPGDRLARRHLVTHARPDYSAVLANAAAAASRDPITIVSGGICGNLRRLARNPCFAGVDLGEVRGHRGCSFCMSATMPPYSPARIDPLPLWERQLRRIQETAGATGRSRGVFEFFDYRAFRRIDEVAALVLRLGLPPSVLLFNPRIDDVLAVRERLERALPELGRAGHELRILSMGVENFSPVENERLNKGITVEQVDELLALARRWETTHPGVFLPFKAGHDQIELGFILFTPWTTLADLRLNLEHATARGFCPTGYWLYSTLDIQEMEPMYRLAQQDGDLLVERFPDRAQVYGVFLNETEVGHLVPWRFRHSEVADCFALLVRVCAAEREGAASAFFRDDAEFAVVARAYHEARQRARITPLAVARALVAVAETRGPGSRAALLAEALARVAPVPASVPTAAADLAAPAAPTAPAAPDAAPPGDAAPPPLSTMAVAVARSLERLKAGARPLADLDCGPVTELGHGGARRIRLTVAFGGDSVIVDLLQPGSAGPCFLALRHFRAIYHRDTPLVSAHHRRRLVELLRLIDEGVATGG